MNIEDLQSRIVSLTSEMNQTKSNYAKLEGHLAETQHWLQKLIMEREAFDNENKADEEL